MWRGLAHIGVILCSSGVERGGGGWVGEAALSYSVFRLEEILKSTGPYSSKYDFLLLPPPFKSS